MNTYLIDPTGALFGPVELPGVPGLGLQLPSNAIQLAIALAAPAPGHVWALFNGEPQQLEDHRGTVYRKDTGAEVQYEQLGVLPPELTAIPKPSAAHYWQNGEWVKDPGQVHAVNTAAVNSACVAAITGGFWSSALGAPHQYSSELDDQLNLTGVILRGFDSPYACRDEQGQKEFRPHTFGQLRQVGDDFTDYKLQLLQRANELKQRLDDALAAGDLVALEAITWVDPQ